MFISNVIDEVQEADVAVARAAAPLMEHPLTRALGQASEIADQPPMFTIGAVVTAAGLLAGRPRVAEVGLRLLASVAIATAVKTGVKRAVARTRPYVLAREGRYEGSLRKQVDKDHNSFPSGHTADAVAAARAVMRVFPELRVPAYAGAAAIGAIQIPRCAHYPSDVSVGALVGYVAEVAADRLLDGVAVAAGSVIGRGPQAG